MSTIHRKVIIIGSGPAGLEAARGLGQRLRRVGGVGDAVAREDGADFLGRVAARGGRLGLGGTGRGFGRCDGEAQQTDQGQGESGAFHGCAA